MSNNAIYLSGIIFAIMALIHLARILCPFSVTVGTYEIPIAVSYFAFLFFGLVAIYLFKERHIKSEEL